MGNVLGRNRRRQHQQQPSDLPAFKLERFFAKHEFCAPYLMCCSDCQPLTMAEVLQLADCETKAMWENLPLGYTETAGLPALRQEIAGMYERLGADDITVLAPEEGVYLAMRALLSPGDRVVCMFPGYQSLYSIAQSMGCQVDLWEPELSSSGQGGLNFQVASLVKLLASGRKAKLVVVNFPHNPTGQLPSRSCWEELVNACKYHGCYLFSDEMYRGLELDDSCRLPSACDLYEHAVTLCGVSKTLGLPGLRIGWLASRATLLPAPRQCASRAGQGETRTADGAVQRGAGAAGAASQGGSVRTADGMALGASRAAGTAAEEGGAIEAAAGAAGTTSGAAGAAAGAATGSAGPGAADSGAGSVTLQTRVRELKDYTTICCSAPSEVLALIALRSRDTITARNLATVRANLKLAEAFFEEFKHKFEWCPPAAGSVAFPRLTTSENVEQFCERVVAGCGVLLLPATVYDHAPSTKAGHFRIGLGRTNFPECLQQLAAFLRKDTQTL